METSAQNNTEAAASNATPANANATAIDPKVAAEQAAVSTPAATAKAPEGEVKQPDAKADAGKSATEQQKKDELDQKKAVAPEKYELKFPDGVKADPKQLESISTFAKAKGMTNEQAQDLLNRELGAVKSFHDSQMTGLQDRKVEWKKQSELDKEIGGEAYPQNVELAHRAITHFGGEALLPMLDATGFGSHPDVVRLFVRIGKAMGEGRLVMPKTQGESKAHMKDRLYGNNTQKKE